MLHTACSESSFLTGWSTGNHLFLHPSLEDKVDLMLAMDTSPSGGLTLPEVEKVQESELEKGGDLQCFSKIIEWRWLICIYHDILYDLHSYIAFHLPFLGCQDPHWESMICIDCFERFALDIRLVGSFPQKVVLFWEAWKLPDPLFGTGSAAWRQGLFGLVGNFKGVVDWKQLNSWREKDKLIRMIVFFAKTFFNENNKDHIHYHTLFICIYIYLRIFVILRITCLCKPSCEKPCAKKIFEVC